jgi:SAM-dependent methyltransferase
MNESAAMLWESLHSGGRMPDDTWPADDIIRQVARLGFAKPVRSSVKCLDVGCGSGPMTWYLAKSGYDVSSVDGSEAAVTHCSLRLQKEGLTASITHSDVCHLPYSAEVFDFCIDCQCLMCLPRAATREAITEIHRVTKRGGYFLSRTSSDICWGFGIGTPVGQHEWKDAVEGPFAGMGLVRFVSRDEIEELYFPFTVVSIEHTQTTTDNMTNTIAMWIIVCKKEEEL